MLTPREAFKAGFLLRCADAGLDGQQAAAAMDKAAGWLWDTSKETGKYIGTAAVTVPLLGGLGAGYLAHRLNNPEVDEDDIRKQEMIQELKHYARRAREQQKVKLLRSSMGA